MDALQAAGGIAYWVGDSERSRAHYSAWLERARRSGRPAQVADACYNLAFSSMVGVVPDVGSARQLLDEALALYRQLGDRGGIARALWGIANVYYLSGNPVAARPAAEESAVLFRALGDRFGLSWALHNLGLIDVRGNDFAAARRAFEESMMIFEEAGDIAGIALALGDFAQLAAREGDLQRAARLGGAGATLGKTIGAGLSKLLEEQEAALGAPVVDRAALETAWGEGAAMDGPAAVAYALRRGAP
jgi:tetratricopeptide (TPR) repeat protein